MSENTTVAVTADAIDESAKESPSSIVSVIESMKSGKATVFSSFKADDFATKMVISSAVSSAEAISDHLGETINLANFIVQPIEMTDENTGELVSVPRVILMDDQNKGYYGISTAILSSLQTMTGILGMPHEWPNPVPVQVTEIKTRKGFRAFNMSPVVAKSGK